MTPGVRLVPWFLRGCVYFHDGFGNDVPVAGEGPRPHGPGWCWYCRSWCEDLTPDCVRRVWAESPANRRRPTP